HRHSAELGHQRPMPADGAFHQPFAREAVESAVLAITWGSGEYERQVARASCFLEAPLERADELLGRASAHEPGAGERVAVADDGRRLRRRDDLVLHADARPRGDLPAGFSSRNSSTTLICASLMSAGAWPHSRTSIERTRPLRLASPRFIIARTVEACSRSESSP